MPIPIEEYQTPTFSRLRDRYPMSYEKSDRYSEVYPLFCAERYQGDIGREGGWKTAGYNPSHQSTRVERINIRTEGFTLKPY